MTSQAVIDGMDTIFHQGSVRLSIFAIFCKFDIYFLTNGKFL
jgi:hypothetical protein